MGVFYTDAIFKNIADRARQASVPQMLVGTGSEATWVPKRVLESLIETFHRRAWLLRL